MMAFDPTTAQPEAGVNPATAQFDPSTAQPEGAHETFLQKISNATSDFVKSAAQGADKVGYNVERGLESVGIPAHLLRAATGDAAPTAQAYQEDLSNTAQSVSGRHPNFEAAGRFTGELGAAVPMVATMGPIAGGAATGALTTDSDTLGGVATDAALGAVGGKVGDLAVRGAAKVIAPKISSAVRELASEGVPLTAGQKLGGAVKSIEDRLTGFPGVGDTIVAKRAEGLAGFNKAVANRVLGTIDQSLPENIQPGHQLQAYVHDAVTSRYDALLPRMIGRTDNEFLSSVRDVGQAAKDSTLPTEQLNRLNAIIKTQIIGKANQAKGVLDGETLKGLQKSLSDLSAGLQRGNETYDNQTLGRYVGQIRDAVMDMTERSSPQLAPELKKTNAAYADYVKLRAAQGAVKGDKAFTPNQFQTALRQTDRSAGKNKFGRGKVSMQDLADNASEVIPSKAGDSGTAGRNALLNPWEWPALIGSHVAGKILYSHPADSIVNALVSRGASPTKNAIAEYVRRGAPLAGAANAIAVPYLASPTKN